jgi:hypothetical protein
MNIRACLASLFVVASGAAPALAQVCDPPLGYHAPYGGVSAPPVVSVPQPVYGNPCAPYAWCGPRDAWGNPVYAAPAYTPYGGTYGYPDIVVLEPLEPHVNGWTGAVEYRPANPYGGLIIY